MTDQQIIKGLIDRDGQVTQLFFFEKCRPLLSSIIQTVFAYHVDYDELVNELYLHLMEDDALRLRQFEGRSSFYQWLKVLAIRFFIRKRHLVVENASHDEDPAMANAAAADTDSAQQAHNDLERLLAMMTNKRYVSILRQLVVNDRDPDRVATEMHITTANLYNLKRRAIAELTQVALKDKNNYDRKNAFIR
ncbi:MAG: sigma-70 family RNA polymerase sigma factor [Prevotella sp.]|nr:sigma-70 family RNA polymerase sigma factor [Prevotella sp.]